MLNENFVYIGIVIGVIGTLGYIIETLKGNVKPNKVTYFMWSLGPIVAFLAQLKQGIGTQSLMTLSVGLQPLAIFIVSFVNKKAYWKLTRFDLSCGLLALLGLILWQVTKVGNIAIIFGILADALGALPTVIKSYKFPETERGWPWLTGSINALFTLLTIRNWSFASYGFSIYYFFLMTLIFVFVQFKIGKPK